MQTKAGYSFRDYLAEYQADTNQQKIKAMVDNLGVDEQLLTELMTARVTEININEYGRFDNLKASVDKQKAREYFEVRDSQPVRPYEVNIKADETLRAFVLDNEAAL